MNEKDHLDTLSDIRNIMERSSRFLSLSGLSGIFIGFYALIGASAAWWYVTNDAAAAGYDSLAPSPDYGGYGSFLTFFLVDVFVTAFALTQRLAKKKGLTIWDTSARRMLINLFLPLIAGGLFCLILLMHHLPGMIAPSMLIFYGLALLNASKYTYNDIRYLGTLEVILGLLAAIDTHYGLLFWALGFGLLHIIYGITMYYKYER